MRKNEMSPTWVHGITLAICFFGWITLSVLVDGIRNRAEASRAFSEAVLFTMGMGVLDLAIWLFRR